MFAEEKVKDEKWWWSDYMAELVTWNYYSGIQLKGSSREHDDRMTNADASKYCCVHESYSGDAKIKGSDMVITVMMLTWYVL